MTVACSYDSFALSKCKEEVRMGLLANRLLMGIIAIVAGIIILIWPAVLVWVVAIILIVYGILMILGKK